MFCTSRRRASKPFASPVAGSAFLRTLLAAAMETIQTPQPCGYCPLGQYAPLKVSRTEDGSIYAAISLR
jgi:hypothetical protein